MIEVYGKPRSEKGAKAGTTALRIQRYRHTDCLNGAATQERGIRGSDFSRADAQEHFWRRCICAFVVYLGGQKPKVSVEMSAPAKRGTGSRQVTSRGRIFC